jgi:hypothetical protein
MTTAANGTVAVGKASLAALTSGAGNVAVGYQALQDNVDGDKNTAIGYQTLKEFEADTDGHGSNTCVGYDSGREMTTGNYNTFIGSEACVSLTTGDENTVVGNLAMGSANGAENRNTIIGRAAGYNIDNGSGNVCLGSGTNLSTAAGTNQIVIGADATGVANNSVTLGNADVTAVYMAQDSGATVHCGGITSNGDVVVQPASDTDAVVHCNASGTGNAFLNLDAGGTTRHPEIHYQFDGTTYWTTKADPDRSHDFVLRDDANSSAIQLRIAQSTGDATFAGTIFVGQSAQTNPAGNDVDGTVFGTTTGINSQAEGIEHKLGRGQDGTIVGFYSAGGAEGSVSISGSTTAFNTSSDYRLKENEEKITDGLERLNKLKPYKFNFKKHPDIKKDGFFAHEVMDIVPEAVSGLKDEIDENNEPKYQGIDQAKLVPILVAAVQELSAKVEALENK